MDRYKYIIIGGGIAGGEAVGGIRAMDEEGSILLISQEQHRPYERPPLSKTYLVEGEGLERRVFLEKKTYYEDQDVDFALGSPVVTIDRGSKRVHLADQREFEYETLLLATGSRANRLPIENAGLSLSFTLRTIEDSQAIRAAAERADRAVVIGGSFIGAETAASLTQLGVRVEMVFPGSHLLEKVAPPDLGRYLHRLFLDRGVAFHTRIKPAEFIGDEAVTHVELANGVRLPADLVVMGVGVQLNTNLAEKAGLKMRGDGSLVVDKFLRTSDPDIYAAGDIAAWPDPHYGKRLRVEHWDVAKNQGHTAGLNMAGGESPYEKIPYFFSDLFDLSFEVWGDLEDWERVVNRGAFNEDGFALFYFRTGRLVGALDAGRPSAERDALEGLVAARPHYADIGAALADVSIELTEESLVENLAHGW